MEFLTGKDRAPGSGWSVRDRGLAEALTEYEDSFCSGCGQKKSVAWDEDTNGWWEVHDVVCEACAALEVARKETKDPEPGAMQYPVLEDDYKPSGAALLKQDHAERRASQARQERHVSHHVPDESLRAKSAQAQPRDE